MIVSVRTLGKQVGVGWGVGVGEGGVRVGGGRGHTVHTNKLVKGVAGRTVTGRTASRDQRHGG